MLKYFLLPGYVQIVNLGNACCNNTSSKISLSGIEFKILDGTVEKNQY